MFLSNTVKNVNNLSSAARRSSRMVSASLKYNKNVAKKNTSSSTSTIRHFASKPTTGVVSSSATINPRPSITRGTAAYLQTLPKAKNNASSFSSYPSYQYDFEDDDEANDSVKEEDIAQHHPCNLLPDERSKMNMTGQGWDIDTVVKSSFIPGAGYGR